MNSTHNPWNDVIEFQTKVLGLPKRPVLGALTGPQLDAAFECLVEEVKEIGDGLIANDGTEVADGLADLIYFAYGFAYKLGLPFPAIWDLVHKANMQKVLGVTHRGVSGDAMKPDGWRDPKHEIAKMLHAVSKHGDLSNAPERPSIQVTMMRMALALADRATCDKLHVGCVLTDFSNRVLSAGYNGPASSRPHCDGSCFSGCRATHAESNAIISCHAPSREIHNCYTTWSPCMACCKQLVQTGCQNIWFINESDEHDKAKEFWLEDSGRTQRGWHTLTVNEP